MTPNNGRLYKEFHGGNIQGAFAALSHPTTCCSFKIKLASFRGCGDSHPHLFIFSF